MPSTGLVSGKHTDVHKVCVLIVLTKLLISEDKEINLPKINSKGKQRLRFALIVSKFYKNTEMKEIPMG